MKGKSMNIDNLKILLNYMETLPKLYGRFDMGVFCTSVKDDTQSNPNSLDIHNCETSMCLLGHSILAGIPALPTEDDWLVYADRVFDLGGWYQRDSVWLFSGQWDGYFPKLEHAILRLRYLIAYGTPPINFTTDVSGNFHFNFADFEKIEL